MTERVAAQWLGFYEEERNPEERWRWSAGKASLLLENPAGVAQRVRLSFQVYAAGTRSLVLRMRGLFAKDLRLTPASQDFAQTVTVPPGTSAVSLEPTGTPVSIAGRSLSFAVRNAALETLD